MRLKRLAFVFAALPPLEAKQDSLSLTDTQSIVPAHHLPWSILLARNPQTAVCTVLSESSQTQFHYAIQAAGDAIAINKSSILDDTTDTVIEILGYNQRNVWGKIYQLCPAQIHYQIPEIEPSSEYEVVDALGWYVLTSADQNTLLRKPH
jgi:hypothetical protein